MFLTVKILITKAISAIKKLLSRKKKERIESIEDAYSACKTGDSQVTLQDLSEYMGTSEKTVRRRLKEHGGFWIEDGEVGKKT